MQHRPAPVKGAPIGDYKVSLDDIAWHVYYGGGGSYLYQPITKCACTKIKGMLLELEGLPVDEDEWRRHQKRHNKFPGMLRFGPRQRRDIFEGRTATFKFVIVRNPYTRLASAYCDKFVQRQDAYWIDQIRRSAEAQRVTLSEPISFEEFVAVVAGQTIGEMDDHWRPQYYEGRFATIRYDFVGRMERMPEDLVYILQRIGAPADMIARAGERSNATGADFRLWESVSPAVRRRYVDAFAMDFDMLDYPRRVPAEAAS